MGFTDPMHAARLAHIEGALAALMHAFNAEAQFGVDPRALSCDEVTATMDKDGLSISYWSEGSEIAGEGA